MSTTRELYEDWKPLLEAEQDALVTVDEEQLLEAQMVEQTNRGAGVSAGGPSDPGYKEPLFKKQTPAVLRAKDEFPDQYDDGSPSC